MPEISRRLVLAAGAASVLPAVVGTSSAADAAAGATSAAARISGPRRTGTLTELERTARDELLVVVTKSQPLDPIDYAPDDLVQWRNGPFEIRAEVADQLELLFDEAETAGHPLRVISGYRSYETQAGTYDYWVREQGRAAADEVSARPGHSEHQTGLAVDLDGPGGCYLDACFGETPAGRWIAQNAYRFGFVISYPDGLEHRTGYAYEPWHIRYVGPATAASMHALRITLLEDYLRMPQRSLSVGALLGRGMER